MPVSTIAEKQQREIAFWRDAVNESPESDSVHNIVNKASDAAILLACIDRHRDKLVESGARVLELGGGQGWASCIYKKLLPGADVTATDISPYALASLPKWERVFNTRIDRAYACTSDATKEPDSSVDLIFCFAAGHHFLAHRRTLREIHRILKPRGKAIYFHEPVTPKSLYRLAHWRVNRKRPDVPEDVLILSTLRRLARDAGLRLEVDYDASSAKRGSWETLYYLILTKAAFLQRLLPCSANLVFTKS